LYILQQLLVRRGEERIIKADKGNIYKTIDRRL
jgi:hypothetical protein